ncbi:MAG: PaaX family transcriptional regulator C-terminal domain-containing protein [Candidatus Auribacterota bacterium]|nr:PaaX family transcriptional regulator C-terminal domain-containing protein [Candidatus Auribacterota bacterium]
MTTLKEELLVLLEEGLLNILNPYRYFFIIGEPYNPRTIYKAVSRLEKNGLVKKFNKEKKIHLQLTQKGRKYLAEHRASDRKPPPPWDHKWRIIIFDIPEEKKQLRKMLRGFLISIGFGKVQRSVWISPHNLLKIVQRYADKLDLSDYIYLITADTFRGIPEREMAARCWNINSLHQSYLNLINEYQRRKNEALKIKPDSSADKRDMLKALKIRLKWDYNSILNRDPRLPPELLPDHWGGEKARIYINQFI